MQVTCNGSEQAVVGSSVIARASLLAVMSLLAETAEGALVQFKHTPAVDSGVQMFPGVSWEPLADVSTAGDSSSMYPGPHTLLMYACFGYMELCYGNLATAGLGIVYSSSLSSAPRLSVGYDVTAVLADGYEWQAAGASTGWIASVDAAGYGWGDTFYVGYRVSDGASGYLYGYAELTANYFPDAQHTMQLTLSRWVYNDTSDGGLTVVPEPALGGVAFSLMGGLAAVWIRRRRSAVSKPAPTDQR